MKRRVFSLASAVSLALFVGASGFWMRSYSLGDAFSYYREPRTFELYSNKGLIYVAWGQLISRNYPRPSGWNGSFWPFHREVDVIEMDVRKGTTFGFAVARWGWQQPGETARGLSLTSPWWFVTTISGILPTIWIIKFRCQRKTVGHCTSCGYSLTGNTSGVCPECGTKLENVSE